jgi:carbonic anhydrase
MCEICRLENLAHRAQPSRRGMLRLFGTAAAGFALAGAAHAKDDKKPPKPQNVVSPDASLELLMKGNKRYVEGESGVTNSSANVRPWSAGRIPMPAS